MDTPEGRVMALCGSISGDKPGMWIAVGALVRKQIRAAENDALERAANRAECFDQNVADAIRALKHDEPCPVVP